ncbi:MAG TPA: ImmA/IrrE family metallo-endopeptidase [Planctomycetaceae bacterium]|nr:ImmA/IrrE family metallo-endopeptidase [Planctomycetaceae bacterium]
MPQPNPMKALYHRLSSVGLTRRFVRETALPSWWEDEIAANAAGYAQGLMLLSRHLGLDLASLQDEAAPLKLRDFGICKYKKRESVSEDELALSRIMATRAAQLAAETISTPPVPLTSDAEEIRQQILDGGAAWVGLGELADYCWSAGVSVLHVDHFPRNARRPDGFAAKVRGRAAIVLCRREKHTAWLLFILAHELGHIALGHIPEDGVLLDEHVEESGRDTEEQQANAFAIALLTGSPSKRFVAADRWPNAGELANEAIKIGRQQMVDPGHVALNYAHSMGKAFFPVGNAALNLLEPNANAVGILRDKMAERMDWSRLPEDSSEFLARVTQLRHCCN